MEYSSGIYEDIPNNQVDLGEEIEKLQQHNNLLQEHIASLESDVEKLCSSITEMKRVQGNLKRNISELYKTAKSEIERKDRQIAQLRSQLEQRYEQRHEQRQFPNWQMKRDRDNSPKVKDAGSSVEKKFKRDDDIQAKSKYQYSGSRSRSRERYRKTHRDRDMERRREHEHHGRKNFIRPDKSVDKNRKGESPTIKNTNNTNNDNRELKVIGSMVDDEGEINKIVKGTEQVTAYEKIHPKIDSSSYKAIQSVHTDMEFKEVNETNDGNKVKKDKMIKKIEDVKNGKNILENVGRTADTALCGVEQTSNTIIDCNNQNMKLSKSEDNTVGINMEKSSKIDTEVNNTGNSLRISKNGNYYKVSKTKNNVTQSEDKHDLIEMSNKIQISHSGEVGRTNFDNSHDIDIRQYIHKSPEREPGIREQRTKSLLPITSTLDKVETECVLCETNTDKAPDMQQEEKRNESNVSIMKGEFKCKGTVTEEENHPSQVVIKNRTTNILTLAHKKNFDESLTDGDNQELAKNKKNVDIKKQERKLKEQMRVQSSTIIKAHMKSNADKKSKPKIEEVTKKLFEKKTEQVKNDSDTVATPKPDDSDKNQKTEHEKTESIERLEDENIKDINEAMEKPKDALSYIPFEVSTEEMSNYNKKAPAISEEAECSHKVYFTDPNKRVETETRKDGKKCKKSTLIEPMRLITKDRKSPKSKTKPRYYSGRKVEEKLKKPQKSPIRDEPKDTAVKIHMKIREIENGEPESDRVLRSATRKSTKEEKQKSLSDSNDERPLNLSVSESHTATSFAIMGDDVSSVHLSDDGEFPTLHLTEDNSPSSFYHMTRPDTILSMNEPSSVMTSSPVPITDALAAVDILKEDLNISNLDHEQESFTVSSFNSSNGIQNCSSAAATGSGRKRRKVIFTMVD